MGTDVTATLCYGVLLPTEEEAPDFAWRKTEDEDPEMWLDEFFAPETPPLEVVYYGDAYANYGGEILAVKASVNTAWDHEPIQPRCEATDLVLKVWNNQLAQVLVEEPVKGAKAEWWLSASIG